MGKGPLCKLSLFKARDLTLLGCLSLLLRLFMTFELDVVRPSKVIIKEVPIQSTKQTLFFSIKQDIKLQWIEHLQ